MKKYWRQLTGFLIGAAITPFAIAAVASAGAGHGSYAAAKLLFPYSMLLTRLSGEAITQPLIALALAQFPAYGLAVTSLKPLPTASVLLVAHATGAILCFAGLLPNFA